MRALPILLIMTATPALAHHEVVMATSIVPTLLGIATIASVGIGTLWRKWRKK